MQLTKFCRMCQERHTLDKFQPRGQCKINARRRAAAKRESRRLWSRKYRAAHLERCRELQRKSYHATKEKRVALILIGSAKARAKVKGWSCDFDDPAKRDAIATRIRKMICEETGLPLTVGKGAKKWNSASLDRIDPLKGYTIDNTRVVCWAVNAANHNWGDEIAIKVAIARLRRRGYAI